MSPVEKNAGRNQVKWKLPVLAGLAVVPFVAAGCTTTGSTGAASQKTAMTHVTTVNGVKTYSYTARDKECLERAMFFESNRSSSNGLLAVGTVVMNRLASGRYGDTLCEVVGQKNQFAPGVLTRRMDISRLPDVEATADALLRGKRHPALKNAMFFHTAGLRFPYRNMHYVLVAGGNSFYEKRNRDGTLQNPVPQTPYNLALAYSPQSPSVPSGPSYDVTQPLAGTAPVSAPNVQTALADAAKTQISSANRGFGPQARGNRLTHERVALAEQPGYQVVAYQPQFDTSTPVQDASAQGGVTSLGYAAADPKQADAIGAILLRQNRPEAPL
ncbi:MAG: cell wall hydrolase [Rhizobiales bacterium]|nr:cell wall hydrolase [Hyphomicrobiales bacterium]OJY06889.1 MAG: cell wall hydrolase [Rhizobiales bacterium 63-22]